MGQSGTVKAPEGVQLRINLLIHSMANAIKEGEIADSDVREALEEIEKEKAEAAASTPPVKEPEPVAEEDEDDEPEPPAKPVEEPKKPDDKPSLPDRPVENEAWKEKQNAKKQRREEEQQRYQKLEEEVTTLRQTLAGVVTKKDFDEFKGLLSNIAGAKDPVEKAEAKDDIDQWLEGRNVDPEFAKGLLDRAAQIAEKRFMEKNADALAFYQGEKERRDKETEAQKQKEAWEARFTEEFDTLSNAEPQWKGHKDDLYKLYFSENYRNYRLADIARLESENLLTPKKKTAETGGAIQSEELVLDTENKDKMAEDILKNWDKMTPEQQDKALDAQFAGTRGMKKNDNKIS